MKTLTRRKFLKVVGTGAAGTVLLGASGCSFGRSDRAGMNVVLIILDSLRKDHVGGYGNPRIKTPNLDALVRESLRFTQAYPESAPTIPARRAIHTGMRTFPFRDRPAQQKEALLYGWLPIPEWQPTLAETLKDKDYRTALVTDTYHQFAMNFGRGFEVYRQIRGQEFDPYKDISSVPEGAMQRYLAISEWNKNRIRQHLANTVGRKSEEEWFAPKVFLRAAESLEEVSRKEPFFLVIDCFDPHEPWDPPDKYVDLYDPEGYEGPIPLCPEYGADDYLTDRQLKRMRALYAAEVTMADRWLGNFLEKAHDTGVMQNTLLVLISDHGIALGEHGFTGKPSYALYPEVTNITFFIRHPKGKLAGQTSDYYASTHDVAPTVLGFLGIEPQKPMEGHDLSALFDSEEPGERKHFTLGYHDHVWARDERYALIARNDGSETKLYDLTSDPGMNEDLAEEHPEVVKRMFEGYVLEDAGGPLPKY
ncbi:MAG: sulfatase-like hydrolase/transferase [Actinomycetota bacterium]|nr:sulfatase-like hydrolase/transferase [Actinomycetota bacterium]